MPDQTHIAGHRQAEKGGPFETGFTLIEVLIAIAIFSIGILAIAKMQLDSVSGNTSARMYTEAGMYITNRIEQLMALPYNDTLLDSAGNPHEDTQGVYDITWTVSDDTPMTNTKTIHVTITWTKYGSKTLTINFIKANI